MTQLNPEAVTPESALPASPLPTSTPVPVGATIESEKPPCDLLLFSHANKFSEAMLRHIPELQGIVIIPLWSPKLANIPNGLLRLRNENTPFMGGLMQALTALAEFGSDIHRDLFTQLKQFQQLSRNLAEEIKAQTAILELTQSDDMGGGATGDQTQEQTSASHA